jgi:hypothetical protein
VSLVAALGLLGLTWQRPWLALLLAVPVLIWFLAARRDRSTLVWTGTLALWSEADPTTTRSRAARNPPRAVLYLVAGLAAAVLALAGPQRATVAAASVWTVVVDRSPSMYLPWKEAGGATRIERALARARELLDARRARSDSVVWLTHADGLEERSSTAVVPPEWLAQPAVPQTEPPWSRHDSPGVLWVTDRDPQAAPRAAGCVASGGASVPGFVAARGVDRVEWDGERLVDRPAAGARPIVCLAPELAGPVERVVRAWAEARGCDVRSPPAPDAVLELFVGSSVQTSEQRSVELERDGWHWQAAVSGAAPPTGETWLASREQDLAVVTWRAGRVAFAPGRFEREPQGDPADFALSWADLLDRAALPPMGVVPFAERLSAGEPSERPPQRASAQGERASSAGWLLAGVAALLSLAALSQRRSAS